MIRTKIRFFLIAAAAAFMLSSCTPKDIAYFQNIDETVSNVDMQATAIRVQPEDKLSIVVHSKDDQLSKLFNLPVVSSNITSTATLSTDVKTIRSDGGIRSGVSLYTVSPEGNIQFPVLGNIHVAGMTRSEVAALIKGEILGRDLVKDPTVTVEFANVGVSVLGEVNSPGRMEVNRDHLSVAEALAMAGDMTINGMRENVMVIRTQNGKRTIYRINMTDAQQALNSPGWYLQQNDVVYVEPNAQQKRAATTNGNNVLSTGFWISCASLLTSVAVLIVSSVR